MNSISNLIKTHKKINDTLCGNAVSLENDFSRVELLTTDEMAVDTSGLVHGGFIFGLADYAAMMKAMQYMQDPGVQKAIQDQGRIMMDMAKE